MGECAEIDECGEIDSTITGLSYFVSDTYPWPV